MKNNEKFLKKWSKNKQKGKRRYMLENIGIFSISYIMVYIIITIIIEKGFSDWIALLITFISALIGSVMGMDFSWNRSEEKYNELMRDK